MDYYLFCDYLAENSLSGLSPLIFLLERLWLSLSQFSSSCFQLSPCRQESWFLVVPIISLSQLVEWCIHLFPSPRPVASTLDAMFHSFSILSLAPWQAISSPLRRTDWKSGCFSVYLCTPLGVRFSHSQALSDTCLPLHLLESPRSGRLK